MQNFIELETQTRITILTSKPWISVTWEMRMRISLGKSNITYTSIFDMCILTIISNFVSPDVYCLAVNNEL
jgi:hypothetical protein